MSEAELHLLKMRLEAGRMNQVKRGAYQQPLPTGLLRLADGTVVKDPDQQVQRIIALIFAKFSELGSSRQVLHYLKREEILLPRRHCAGRHAGDLLWKAPTDSTLLSILHNPAYAGGSLRLWTKTDRSSVAAASTPSRRTNPSSNGRVAEPATRCLPRIHFVGAVSR